MTNLEAHIFQPDYAIVTGHVPKWSDFHVLCDGLTMLIPHADLEQCSFEVTLNAIATLI